MERKRITCPETAHLEEIDVERTPLGTVIAGCSRFSPGSEVTCARECAARMDRRDRRDRDDHTERILVAYAGADAQTATIARTLAGDLAQDGLIVEEADLDRELAPPPADYEAVVVVAPARFGRLARAVQSYIAAHRPALAAMTGVLVSVQHGDSRRALDRVVQRTGWQPTLEATLERPGWLARRFGDRGVVVDSVRVYELARAIADELPAA